MARILVADDEEGVRTFIAESLALDGHQVAEAGNGEAALQQLNARTFDLLITDLRMPNVDGMTLVRSVRAQQPELEVIVVTAHGSVETAVEAMKLGAFDYLQKPIDSPAEIRLLAARALERRHLLAFREKTVREASGEVALTYGDPVMLPVVDALRKVAATDATVLLVGESGTGKEVAARAIHRWSRRANEPFVAVNCAALAESLIESELFGHEKGAFTSAVDRRRGRIVSSSPTAARSSWMRWVSSSRGCRPSSCACLSNGGSNGSAVRAPSKSTCAGSRRPIAILMA